MTNILKINPADNVVVAIQPQSAGAVIEVDGKRITVLEDVPAGHKIAIKDLAEGENVIKYGFPIGHAKEAKKAALYYEKARELAYKITKWTRQITEYSRPCLITGGGPGIMEAGNRGAKEAGGISLGMTISLPKEQEINPYCTPGASMQFHYFFMRKLWLLFKTRAFVAFPGGIGTLDEIFEILTLIQTKKVRKFPIVLFGSEFWKPLINFQLLIDWGLIHEDDLDLFRIMDDVDEASEYLQKILTPEFLDSVNIR